MPRIARYKARTLGPVNGSGHRSRPRIHGSAAPAPPRSPTRAIAFLALASVASQAMVRAPDTLLPQIAADFGISVGTASIVITAYAITHGSMQLVIGPIGDRIGKYRIVAIACALSAVTVALCGLAQSLNMLAIARLASGATAAWIIPARLAFVGDVVPYEQRQQVLGRFLAGQVLGQMFGQAAGGVIGDYFGWRNVFFLLSAHVRDRGCGAGLRARGQSRHPHPTGQANRRGLRADYVTPSSQSLGALRAAGDVSRSRACSGIFPFVGADLHLRFGLSFTAIGLIVGAFGIGGLFYARTVKPLMTRLGQSGIARSGGLIMAGAFLVLAIEPIWWLAPLAVRPSGSASTCCTTPCRPTARRWRRRRAAPRSRCSPRSIFSARPSTWRWRRRWWTASARRRCSWSAWCCCRSWRGGSRGA